MPDYYGHLGLKFIDHSGEVTSMPLYFRVADTTTLAVLIPAAVLAADKVEALTDGELTKVYIAFETDNSEVHPPVAGSRIEKTGLFKALYSDGFNRSFGVDVPCLEDAVLVPGGKRIDFSNAAVENFVTMLTGGQTPMFFTSPSGRNITSVSLGRQTFRKHRRVANRH